MNFKSDREKINVLKSFKNNPIQKEKNYKICEAISWLLNEYRSLKSRVELLERYIKLLGDSNE